MTARKNLNKKWTKMYIFYPFPITGVVLILKSTKPSQGAACVCSETIYWRIKRISNQPEAGICCKTNFEEPQRSKERERYFKIQIKVKINIGKRERTFFGGPKVKRYKSSRKNSAVKYKN